MLVENAYYDVKGSVKKVKTNKNERRIKRKEKKDTERPPNTLTFPS